MAWPQNKKLAEMPSPRIGSYVVAIESVAATTAACFGVSGASTILEWHDGSICEHIIGLSWKTTPKTPIGSPTGTVPVVVPGDSLQTGTTNAKIFFESR